MKLLTNKQQESNEHAKICYICKGMFEDKYAKDKKYKVRDHRCDMCQYSGAANSMCNFKIVYLTKLP